MTEKLRFFVPAMKYSPLSSDTHRLDRSLLTLRLLVLGQRKGGRSTSEQTEAADELSSYFAFVLENIGTTDHTEMRRIGDPDWDDLFVRKDRRLVASAVRALKKVAHGRFSAADVGAVDYLLREIQRRRRACDSYDEITSYDKALDLL